MSEADRARRRRAARFGMWIFLCGEVLLFGALFALYAGARARWREAFAVGATETVLWMGTVDTVVLLCASFLVVAGLHAVRRGKPGPGARRIAGAALLGSAFLGLKLWEYARHVQEGLVPYGGRALAPGARDFWTLYYVMTGAHALHVTGGVALLAWLARGIRRGAIDGTSDTPLELGGMYWHLVDVVWLYLWPIFYLLRV